MTVVVELLKTLARLAAFLGALACALLLAPFALVSWWIRRGH